jgi:arabinogalactan oligomer/maltooligosaccharide transport system permease protein
MNNKTVPPSPGFKNVFEKVKKFLKYILLALADAGLIWFTYKLISIGYYPISIVLIIIVIFITYVYLSPKAKPLRWMAIGISALILFSIFPIFYTVYNAFTNYGDGHLISKTQAIEQIQKQQYLPEEGKSYTWVAYRSPENDYLLWIKDKNGSTSLVRPIESKADDHILDVVEGQNGIGEIDADGAPLTIEGFTRLNKVLASTDKNLTQIKFGDPQKTIQIDSPTRAAELIPLYQYDKETNVFTNLQTGLKYYDQDGTWTATDGSKLSHGYIATIGFDNFVKFVTSPALRGPLLIILAWNFAFAFLSLFMTFSLGLSISILFGDPHFPGKKLLRTLLLVPYTIPSLITILIWRGMMNPEIGVINRVLESLFGISPDWFNNQWLARAALLIVNLWLGYPYWMLVTSGALQSIPSDIYEAAQVDGASGWQRFWSITLPLLLVSVGPLMISSFIFNFNNFNLIYAFIGGGPPIPTATTNAGYTDILISYVYNLAFVGGRGINYGFASAISIFIFIFVALMSLVQFRFTNMWEEVGENV